MSSAEYYIAICETTNCQFYNFLNLVCVSFQDCSDKLAATWGIPQVQLSVLDDRLHEICRYGGAELHAVASFLGGVAAQEAIKLITHQYVPVADAFIYNGIKPSTTTFRV